MNSLFEQQEQGFEFIGNGFALKKTDEKDKVHLYNNGSFVKEHIDGSYRTNGNTKI